MSLLKQRIKKPKLLRSNPTRLSLLNAQDNDDDLSFDDDSLITGYRRRDLDKSAKLVPQDELSEHVKFRLFLARQLAMMKYKEKWG